MHITADGDWIGKIAARYNNPDPDQVYNLESNTGLREKRPEKNLLVPGDPVNVPITDPPAMPTRGKNGGPIDIAVTPPPPEGFTVKFENAEGTALSNLDYRLNYSGIDEEYADSTDSEGKIDLEIPPGTDVVTVTFEEHEFTFNLGHLRPPGLFAGVADRLKNLDYYHGEISNEYTEELAAAIRKYQDDNDLQRSGLPDGATLDHLENRYGC